MVCGVVVVFVVDVAFVIAALFLFAASVVVLVTCVLNVGLGLLLLVVELWVPN